ncbi:MAG: hypothetical protein AAB223_09315 [Pseudomonadota bacterium]
MRRHGIALRGTATVLFIALAGALSLGLYVVKHRVIELEGRLTEINRGIARDQQAIHVLRAEWSYLNEPARLRDLASRHLGMTPATGGQFGAPMALPVRLAPEEEKP